MNNQLMSVSAAAELLRAGRSLAVAGPESALDQLPAGRWIGGTIPYFMTDAGGCVVQADLVFVTDLSSFGEDVSITCLGADELSRISGDAPDNGVALAILPAGSATHQRFASEAASYPDAFVKPTVGWISGVHLGDLGRVTPKVYDGSEARKHEDRAVVAHVRLPADKLALVEIVNLFEPEEGDVLHFDETRFEVGECSINGERVRLSDYITSRGLEHGRQPLIGDFAGAKVNVSLQSVDGAQGLVHLYAPVFPGVDYRFAKPQPDYAEHFRSEIAGRDTSGAAWSCNCILNFVFGELEGKRIGGLSGPITFGEIGYQLLNQTMVTLRVV